MHTTLYLPPARLKALLREAYEDGHQDGARDYAEANGHDPDAIAQEVSPDDWENSVTADRFDALIKRVNMGGKP